MLIQDRRASNRFLEGLAGASRRRLMDAAEAVQLEHRRVLVQRGGELTHVYFPLGAVISLVFTADGRRLEVAPIGREGFFGLGVALGSRSSELEALVQAPGEALRIAAADFRALLRDDTGLRRKVDRYAYLMLSHMARNAACIRFHLVEQRLARWLLTTADRTQSQIFGATHAFLAELLGVRRVGVTTAALLLQQRGLIHYTRGTVAIRDRDGLRRTACACYRDDLEAYARHFD